MTFRVTAFLLLAGLIVPIYFNSLNADWHLDDEPNILLNPGLHLQTLSVESIGKALFADKVGRSGLYRPLACLSFALNWYVGEQDPFGYHLVNIGLHGATAWALYLLCLSLLEVHSGTRMLGKADLSSIALLAAALWAVNPIQTQAVTYIVQRMAVMTALFYVLGMHSYVRARTARSSFRRRLSYGACFIWFACGLGSKENAIVLPLALLLVEWIVFQGGRLDFVKRPSFWGAAGILTVIALCLGLALTGGAPLEYLQGKYVMRPFTMGERLMTQPRVVLGYLSQLLYPLPGRLSIAHDIPLSTSLFHPWTTLPAMAAVAAGIVLAILGARRYPLLAMAVLFFFLNHGVESTFYPLELVFEHRNYLPALLLFLPVAAGLQRLLVNLKRSNHKLHAATAGTLAMALIGLGMGTHTRNTVWATEKSLWTDAVRKAPGNYRALFYAGLQFAWDDDPTPAKYRLALRLFERCMGVVRQDLKDSDHDRASLLGNMASIFYRTGHDEKAIILFHRALDLRPDYGRARYDLMNALIRVDRLEEAVQQSEQLVALHPRRPDYQNGRGFLLLWSGRDDQALACFQKALGQGGSGDDLMLRTGVALTRLKSWRNGIWFLQQAARQRPTDPIPWLVMIENRLRAGDRKGAERSARRLVTKFPVTTIADSLKTIAPGHRRPPIAVALVRPLIGEALETGLTELLRHE